MNAIQSDNSVHYTCINVKQNLDSVYCMDIVYNHDNMDIVYIIEHNYDTIIYICKEAKGLNYYSHLK